LILACRLSLNSFEKAIETIRIEIAVKINFFVFINILSSLFLCLNKNISPLYFKDHEKIKNHPARCKVVFVLFKFDLFKHPEYQVRQI